MTDRDNVVEVPLDPKYLTPDGFYMAGYLWGRHIRSVKGGVPEGANDVFKQGVEDGFGDGMARNHDALEDMRKEDKMVKPLSPPKNPSNYGY